MAKAVVIYSSKYGATKKYAEWIAEALSADIFEDKKFDVKKFADYGTIIFGCGLYAGQLSLKNMLTKNFEQIKSKRIAFFSVGLEDPSKAKEKIISLFPVVVKVFCFRGALKIDDLGFVHKQGLNMLNFMLSKKKPDELTETEKDILAAIDKKSVDFMDKNAILPLVEFVKE